MNAVPLLTSVLTSLALLLSAASAHATNYTFAGRFTSSRGRIINIPLAGNTGCADLTLMSNYGKHPIVVPQTMTPTVIPITRGVNTQPIMKTGGGKVVSGIDLLCVKHVPGVMVQTTGTMPKVGGGFTLPAKVWHDTFPTMDPLLGSTGPVAVQVKYVTGIVQLATSFRISGPNPLSKIMSSRFPMSMVPYFSYGGTMATSLNLAPWLKFDKLANIPVGMRSGRVPGPAGFSGKFTWCPGKPDCVNIGSAPAGTKAIVKYSGGGNQFGGTMSALVTSGVNPSSLAITFAGSTGPVGFVIVAASGSAPTGRGYAHFATDMLKSGFQFSMHKEMVVTKPIVGAQKLITAVTMTIAPQPRATSFHYGFPFTTRRVLARITGTALGNPMVTTLTAEGYDCVDAKGRGCAVETGMGARNISLVAGGIGITNLLGLGTQTPEIASMSLPEPGMARQMLAGVLALLGVAAWRARRNR